MNLIGMGLLIKGLNEMSKHGGGGGGYHTYGPSAEEVLLSECRKTLIDLEGKENISNTEVPAVTLKGKEKLSIKKRKNQKLNSIQILEANPNGVKIDGVSLDLSKYSIIGTIDNKSFFALDKNTKEMIVVDIKECYSYGPHGDFFSFNNLVNTPPKNDETSEIYLDFKLVREDEIKVGVYANLPQRRCYMSELDKNPDITGFFELANHIRGKYLERQANNNASEKGE